MGNGDSEVGNRCRRGLVLATVLSLIMGNRRATRRSLTAANCKRVPDHDIDSRRSVGTFAMEGEAQPGKVPKTVITLTGTARGVGGPATWASRSRPDHGRIVCSPGRPLP
jgi:hypothetical protein